LDGRWQASLDAQPDFFMNGEAEANAHAWWKAHNSQYSLAALQPIKEGRAFFITIGDPNKLLMIESTTALNQGGLVISQIHSREILNWTAISDFSSDCNAGESKKIMSRSTLPFFPCWLLPRLFSHVNASEITLTIWMAGCGTPFCSKWIVFEKRSVPWEFRICRIWLLRLVWPRPRITLGCLQPMPAFLHFATEGWQFTIHQTQEIRLIATALESKGFSNKSAFVLKCGGSDNVCFC
jgi:hypothetical protein